MRRKSTIKKLPNFGPSFVGALGGKVLDPDESHAEFHERKAKAIRLGIAAIEKLHGLTMMGYRTLAELDKSEATAQQCR